MRQITNDSIKAFLNARKFNKQKMNIKVIQKVTILKLHGNSIAFKYNDPEKTLSITNCGWFSNTTKERLNALPNVKIYQKNFEWFLKGKKWNGELIDIK